LSTIGASTKNEAPLRVSSTLLWSVLGLNVTLSVQIALRET
jgi:hypothetical protein